MTARRAKLHLGGFHQFLALQLHFPQENLRVGMIRFDCQDRFNFICGVIKLLHIEIHFGTSILNLGRQFRDPLQFKPVESLQGPVEVLGNPLGPGTTQGRTMANRIILISFVLGGPAVNFMSLTKLPPLHRNIAIGDFDLNFLRDAQGTSRLAGPRHERLDQLLLPSLVTAVNHALQCPLNESHRKLTMNGQKLAPILIQKIPGAFFVTSDPVSL